MIAVSYFPALEDEYVFEPARPFYMQLLLLRAFLHRYHLHVGKALGKISKGVNLYFAPDAVGADYFAHFQHVNHPGYPRISTLTFLSALTAAG